MNILLTGAASGIGRCITNKLAKAGHNLLAADIDLEALEATRCELGWQEPQVQVRRLDVRDADQWNAIVQETITIRGSLDVLLNVAGVIRPEFLRDMTPANVALQLDVNTKGVILGTLTAAKSMIQQQKGHIVNIASMAGLAPIPGISVYSASKFAVRGFTLAVAAELAPLGVHVSCVYPDATQTAMLDYQVDFDAAAMTFSAPTLLSADDVANVIIERVLVRRPLEVDIPAGRGWTARISNLLPTFLTRKMVRDMTDKGLAIQRKVQVKRSAPGQG